MKRWLGFRPPSAIYSGDMIMILACIKGFVLSAAGCSNDHRVFKEFMYQEAMARLKSSAVTQTGLESGDNRAEML